MVLVWQCFPGYDTTREKISARPRTSDEVPLLQTHSEWPHLVCITADGHQQNISDQLCDYVSCSLLLPSPILHLYSSSCTHLQTHFLSHFITSLSIMAKNFKRSTGPLRTSRHGPSTPWPSCLSVSLPGVGTLQVSDLYWIPILAPVSSGLSCRPYC